MNCSQFIWLLVFNIEKTYLIPYIFKKKCIAYRLVNDLYHHCLFIVCLKLKIFFLSVNYISSRLFQLYYFLFCTFFVTSHKDIVNYYETNKYLSRIHKEVEYIHPQVIEKKSVKNKWYINSSHIFLLSRIYLSVMIWFRSLFNEAKVLIYIIYIFSGRYLYIIILYAHIKSVYLNLDINLNNLRKKNNYKLNNTKK